MDESFLAQLQIRVDNAGLSPMSRYLALIPAAGAGSRMGQTPPKQYLPILNRPLLYYSIARLCAHALVERVYVVLAAADRWFNEDWNRLPRSWSAYAGGESRADGTHGLQRIERGRR
jgi:2-C-methyl-D-erythritol 4-phosphate cytidylyltransferase